MTVQQQRDQFPAGARPDRQLGTHLGSRALVGAVTPRPETAPEHAGPRAGAGLDPEEARQRAIEERVIAARRDKLQVTADVPPYLRITSQSRFSYRVHLRGGAAGPHSCDCPDFEANRLHTCKHVERARAHLGSPRGRLTPAAGRAAPRLSALR